MALNPNRCEIGTQTEIPWDGGRTQSKPRSLQHQKSWPVEFGHEPIDVTSSIAAAGSDTVSDYGGFKRLTVNRKRYRDSELKCHDQHPEVTRDAGTCTELDFQYYCSLCGDEFSSNQRLQGHKEKQVCKKREAKTMNPRQELSCWCRSGEVFSTKAAHTYHVEHKVCDYLKCRANGIYEKCPVCGISLNLASKIVVPLNAADDELLTEKERLDPETTDAVYRYKLRVQREYASHIKDNCSFLHLFLDLLETSENFRTIAERIYGIFKSKVIDARRDFDSKSGKSEISEQERQKTLKSFDLIEALFKKCKLYTSTASSVYIFRQWEMIRYDQPLWVPPVVRLRGLNNFLPEVLSDFVEMIEDEINFEIYGKDTDKSFLHQLSVLEKERPELLAQLDVCPEPIIGFLIQLMRMWMDYKNIRYPDKFKLFSNELSIQVFEKTEITQSEKHNAELQGQIPK